MFNAALKRRIADLEAELSEHRQVSAAFHQDSLHLLLDAQGRIEDFNENFARCLGYAPGSLTGRNLDDLIPDYVKCMDCYRELQ